MNGITKLMLRGTSDINAITLENLREVEKKCLQCPSTYMGRVGDSGVYPACQSILNGHRRNSGGKKVRPAYTQKRGKTLAQ
jgi:hypothetical protein